ncbi:M23 family metallopeptidase [Novosphingobium album (ex Liu et al. 2023)]|uniref:M23 family metallopeptidase n=1 Tax=Novosphingobium album (ex Liu et al. 2023) TaxID=3031130 RepID=A0ABT5WUY4_9SPHN|nr:M23 family metallopeptidase [Novosphingobium album (ex Liu et al. 2023)]MDE8653716.1 M23 family metallopeptidase [Novosphingobium album (ex Liu et al. 2023)]
MEEFSFDPRSWGRGNPPAGKAGRDKADSASSALPEAWRKVADTFAPGQAGEADAPVENAPRAKWRHIAIALAALSVLSGVGAWYHFTRAPGTLNLPGAGIPPDAEATATTVERALNLKDAGELANSLDAVGIPMDEARAAAGAAAPLLTKHEGLRARLAMEQAGATVALQRLQLSYADGSGVVVSRGEEGQFTTRAIAAELVRQIKVLNGELDSESFYTSAVSAGLMDSLIPEFINAFGYDFNLASEVTPGDTFEVAYEQSVNENGEPVGPPKLLFASLTTKTRSLALYRYVGPDAKAGWYDGNGASTKRGLMRTPIDGARITSGFGMRFHPVLHYTRLHGGTDFAAPVGTPIYAARDGTVTSASPSRCAGNMVIIQHDNGWETRYFHLSRYADGLHAGQHVTQGDTIGYVGSTGTCTTGPHLHYEVHINGEKVDPLSVKTDDATRKRMAGSMLAGFLRERDRVDVARAQTLF